MQYIYKNPENGEIKEVTQGINDEHVYSEDGQKWDRVFTAFHIADSTPVDPFSSKQFVEKTRGKGTMGDVYDRAAEMSQMRADKNGGVDDVKEKAEKEYSSIRGGRSAPKSLKDLVVNL